jgi:hypothetical protein
MTTRHYDIVAILAQQLKKFNKQMIDLAENKKKSFKMKLGWNSTICLPYGKKDEVERDETIDKRFEDEARRKPDLWYYKIDDKVIKNETIKVLQLNLVEVTVPDGYANVEFGKTKLGK